MKKIDTFDLYTSSLDYASMTASWRNGSVSDSYAHGPGFDPHRGLDDFFFLSKETQIG